MQPPGVATCTDCGTALPRIRYVRRATLYEIQQRVMLPRDPLCKPCWDKQDHD